MKTYMRDRREKQKAEEQIQQAEEQRQRELNTERVKRFREAHPDTVKEYSRKQRAEWRKKLAVLKAAKVYVEGKSVAEQYDDLVRLNKAADDLMREVGIKS